MSLPTWTIVKGGRCSTDERPYVVQVDGLFVARCITEDDARETMQSAKATYATTRLKAGRTEGP